MAYLPVFISCHDHTGYPEEQYVRRGDQVIVG